MHWQYPVMYEECLHAIHTLIKVPRHVQKNVIEYPATHSHIHRLSVLKNTVKHRQHPAVYDQKCLYAEYTYWHHSCILRWDVPWTHPAVKVHGTVCRAGCSLWQRVPPEPTAPGPDSACSPRLSWAATWCSLIHLLQRGCPVGTAPALCLWTDCTWWQGVHMSVQLYHLVLGQIAPGDREFTCQYSSTTWSWDRLHLVTEISYVSTALPPGLGEKLHQVAGSSHVQCKSSTTWTDCSMWPVVHMSVQLYRLVLGQIAPGGR